MNGVITSATSLLVAIPVAVIAGLVSFLSPCVLPLLPGYMAFLSGAAGTATGTRSRHRALAGSLVFVVGFALVFVSFGALFGGFGRTMSAHQRGLELVFGILTIVLGFFFAGWLPVRTLTRERRIHFLPRASILGAGMLGVLFALGWTPCIGPTLGTILGLAAASSGATALRGSLLAFFYCLGLGVPFILAAVAAEWTTNASAWFRRHTVLIGRIGGVVLIAIGVLEATGTWHHFVVWLQTHYHSSTTLL